MVNFHIRPHIGISKLMSTCIWKYQTISGHIKFSDMPLNTCTYQTITEYFFLGNAIFGNAMKYNFCLKTIDLDVYLVIDTVN